MLGPLRLHAETFGDRNYKWRPACPGILIHAEVCRFLWAKACLLFFITLSISMAVHMLVQEPAPKIHLAFAASYFSSQKLEDVSIESRDFVTKVMDSIYLTCSMLGTEPGLYLCSASALPFSYIPSPSSYSYFFLFQTGAP